MIFSTPEGRVPLVQTFPDDGTAVGFNIWVRSTTAS